MTRKGKPRRNDPCPCGSGKKFKKCHYKSLGEDRAEIAIKAEARRKEYNPHRAQKTIDAIMSFAMVGIDNEKVMEEVKIGLDFGTGATVILGAKEAKKIFDNSVPVEGE